MERRTGCAPPPGGAKDIDFARDRILAGEVPHASTFTAEGLLSQYDLPLPSKCACTQILCLSGAAMKADLIRPPSASAPSSAPSLRPP